MTPTPPSTNSSAGARSPEDQFRVVRRRNRVPLSCYPCRTRKLKCDRGHPCSNCTKREGTETVSCSYASPASRKKSTSQDDSSPDDMQNRIDRLEGLVLSLMHGGANVDAGAGTDPDHRGSLSQSLTDSGSSAKVPAGEEIDIDESDPEDALAASLGMLKMDKDKSFYIGQEHWHSILFDIQEVKTYFNAHKKELVESFERVKNSKPLSATGGPTLLLGAVPASELELRAELPPKTTVLTLCGRYFNSRDNSSNIVHGPTFQRQLREHWEDPSKTPIMWLGLLYAVITLAMVSYHKVGDEPTEWRGKTLELATEYRLRTVQCLIKADYTKSGEHTIETMMLYLFGEYAMRWDSDLGLWLTMSLITRIAFRQGYHRDAKWFPAVSPFHAEMRRRTWALIRMADVIFSNQVSLPHMINDSDCDTQLPNNLFDDEFYPGIPQLPPSRPITEATPVAYMIAKARLCIELGNILQAIHRVGKPVPYDEIIRFDAKLQQIMHELPPHLKLAPLEQSQDPMALIMARYSLDILFQKIICLLHKNYVPRARQNPRYAHSRRTAIEASLQALDHLELLEKESRADGRLRSAQWLIRSIATKDFSMPAMLVLWDLHFDDCNAAQDTEGAFHWDQAQRQRMIRSLEQANQLWRTLATTSEEALKVSKVMDVMLPLIKGRDQALKGNPELSADAMSNMAGLSNINMIDPSLGPENMFSPSNWASFTVPNFGDSSNNGFAGFDLTPSTAAGFKPDDLGMSNGDLSFASMNPAPSGPMAGNFGDFSTSLDWGVFDTLEQMPAWGADVDFGDYMGHGEQQARGQ